MSTEFISERLLKISIREGNKINHHIQVYAPCNDSYSDEDLLQKNSLTQSTTSRNKMTCMPWGVSTAEWEREEHLGPHSDHRTPCNYNGNHILELCAEHDLIVTYTFFQRRDTQIYTWYKWNNIDASSQIDFTLVRYRMRCNIRDSRVIPSAGLDIDHRPVITTLVTEKKRKITKIKKQLERLNVHKLQDEEVQTKIKCTISGKLDCIDPTLLNVDEAWDSLKTVLLDTIREACGTKKTGGRNRKATAWWNKEVRDAIKEKKKLYKIWAKTKDEADYIKCRLARRHSKKVVRTAKEKAWTQYGEKLCETCKTSQESFTRV